MAPIPSRLTTMSDDGDRLCPLCAEEMDLTDQQLKPCKCGYEICVWCWHHIMDLAEKEETEGRCPACRTPYDKERIVGMSANCERLVAEMNGGRRQRPQKGKLKVSAEARKHLSTVRVVQRNLVYIIGLPSNLCDESLLERKEYFGQYGEILKVSVSRPASITNQQTSNTNVYITYAREEDAVRCIQAVHNYLLDGKRIRACFGTTKYCHAWLRNMSCSNPDCLYLHDIGSQEDSFTKDEAVPANTRNGALQAPSSNLQRRAGSLLPSPVEDSSSLQTASGKHSVNNVSKNSESQASVSNGYAGRLPALSATSCWGSHASNGTMPSTSSLKQKVETKSHSSSYSSFGMAANEASSAWHDDEVSTLIADERHSRSLSSEYSKFHPGNASPTTESDMPSVSLHFDALGFGDSAWDDDSGSSKSVEGSSSFEASSSSSAVMVTKCLAVDGKCQTSEVDLSTNSALDKAGYSFSQVGRSGPTSPVSQDEHDIFLESGKKIDAEISMAEETLSKLSCSAGANGRSDVNRHTHPFCFGSSPANLDRKNKHCPIPMHENDAFVGPSTMLKSPLPTEEHCDSKSHKNLASFSVLESPVSSNAVSNLNSELPKMDFDSIGDDIKLADSTSTVQKSSLPHFSHILSNGNHKASISVNEHDATAITSVSEDSILRINAVVSSALSNERNNDKLRNIHIPEGSLDTSVIKTNGGFQFSDSYNDSNEKNASVNTKESSIITDILSLDFDPWNDSLSLANDLSSLLSENEGQNGSIILSRSRISPKTSQSRFSFARQQENQAKLVEPSSRNIEHMKREIMHNDSRGNDFPNGSTDNLNGRPSMHASDNPAGISRMKMSAPPGFSVPSRSPPPGFHDRDHYNRNFIETISENHRHRNQREVQSFENSGDVEFIDPAILAIGKGHMPLGTTINNFDLRSSLPTRFRSEGDLIHQLLMKQQNASPRQNTRILDPLMDNFLPLNDSYATSCLLPQNHGSLSPLLKLSLQQPRNSPISTPHWDGWNNKQSNSALSFTNSMMNGTFELNNSYNAMAEYRPHIPSSGNVYNRAFGL